MFQSGQASTFTIEKQDSDLTIYLEPYTVTDNHVCGEARYFAEAITTNGGYDPFTPGQASIDQFNGILTFNNFDQFTEGTMTVKVDIKYDLRVEAYLWVNDDCTGDKLTWTIDETQSEERINVF